MSPDLNEHVAARILDLADPAARPRRPRAIAASALFLAISAFVAHAVARSGSPTAARAAEMSPAGATNAHAESQEMKQLLSRLSVAGAVAVGSSAFAQDAVQWRVEDGGNGHWYELRNMTSTSWFAHRDATIAIGGHLATITSPAEDSFVQGLIRQTVQWLFGPTIGLFQLPGAAEPDRDWQWVTGEPFQYSGWFPGEPNNGPGYGEHWVRFRFTNGTLAWNDVDESAPAGEPLVSMAIVEWSADCNSDGIVDYGQIRAGELDDANANNIPDCCEAGTACGCAADISGNGVVDAVDLAAVLSSWGNAPTGKTNADINRDGEIDAIDLAEVLSSWGACP
jgi:hypothetical protein